MLNLARIFSAFLTRRFRECLMCIIIACHVYLNLVMKRFFILHRNSFDWRIISYLTCARGWIFQNVWWEFNYGRGSTCILNVCNTKREKSNILKGFKQTNKHAKWLHVAIDFKVFAAGIFSGDISTLQIYISNGTPFSTNA